MTQRLKGNTVAKKEAYYSCSSALRHSYSKQQGLGTRTYPAEDGAAPGYFSNVVITLVYALNALGKSKHKTAHPADKFRTKSKSLDGNRKERNFPFSRHHKPYCSHLSDLQGQESFLSCTYTNIRRGDRNDTLDRHFRIVVFFLKMTVQQLLPFLLQCVMMFSLLGASLVRWFIIL